MKSIPRFRSMMLGLGMAILTVLPVRAQGIARLGEPLPDFSLPSVQGGTVSLAGLKGKNVMIVFPRGLVEPNRWCQICHYQYLELADAEKNSGLKKKYNMEILFILPYDLDSVKTWSSIFKEQMAVIEEWRNPKDEATNPRAKQFAARVWKEMPKSFDIKDEKPDLPFSILADTERKVSKMLRLFTTEWDRAHVPQNVPTVLLLDRDGVVQFKYMSQTTWDRPKADDLVRLLDLGIIGKGGM